MKVMLMRMGCKPPRTARTSISQAAVPPTRSRDLHSEQDVSGGQNRTHDGQGRLPDQHPGRHIGTAPQSQLVSHTSNRNASSSTGERNYQTCHKSTVRPDSTQQMPPPAPKHSRHIVVLPNGIQSSRMISQAGRSNASFSRSLDAFRYTPPGFPQEHLQSHSYSQQPLSNNFHATSECSYRMSGALPHEECKDETMLEYYQNPNASKTPRESHVMQPPETTRNRFCPPISQSFKAPVSRHFQGPVVQGSQRSAWNGGFAQNTPTRTQQSHSLTHPQFSSSPKTQFFQQPRTNHSRPATAASRDFVEDEPRQLFAPLAPGRSNGIKTLNSLSFVKDPYTSRESQANEGRPLHRSSQLSNATVQRPITKQFSGGSSNASNFTPHRPIHRVENRSSSSQQRSHQVAPLPLRNHSRLSHVKSSTYQFPSPSAFKPYDRPISVTKGPLRVGARSSRGVLTSSGMRCRVVR